MKTIIVKKAIAAVSVAGFLGLTGSAVAFAIDPVAKTEKKVTICHKAGKHRESLTVAEDALKAHIGHGDTIGKCQPGPNEYTLVFRMPDDATSNDTTWYPQTFLNRNGVVPDEGCAKFQYDGIRITNPKQEKALEAILADGILTKDEATNFPSAGFVGGGQVWYTDKCGVTPTPTQAPTETQTPTQTPTKPPVVPPKPKPVITKDLVQEDTYRYTSARELRTIKAYAADKKLVYREDKAQWNDSTWRIIERTFTNGKLTSAKVVKAGGHGARAKGSKIVMTWKLGKGATVNAPWGVKKNIPQTFVR